MIDNKLRKQHSGDSRQEPAAGVGEYEEIPGQSFRSGFLRPAYEGTELEAPTSPVRRRVR